MNKKISVIIKKISAIVIATILCIASIHALADSNIVAYQLIHSAAIIAN